MNLLEKWADAIRTHEGWGPGTRAQRNNNEGNTKFYTGGYRAIYGKVRCDKDGFAIFETRALGRLYLVNKLRNAATGLSFQYRANMTLGEFFKVYAEDDPYTPENDPVVYAEFVAGELGVEVSTVIKNLIS